MANVVFSGSVSAQASSGETVTITVTLPGGDEETLSAQTLADRTFSVSKQYFAGNYTATFAIAADARYKAVSTGPVPFVVELEDRSLTVNVQVNP